MARQYKRYCKLIVAVDGSNEKAFDFSEYRIVFHVDQAYTGQPCTANIKVYNVPQSIANQIKQESQAVILDAGYEENHAVIFKGQLVQRYRGRENQTDTYLQIIASTGDTAHRYGVVNVSLRAGATPEDIYNEIARVYGNFGIEKGNMPELPKTELPRGKVIYQAAKSALENFSKTHAMQWSYEQNRLVCVPVKGTTEDDPITVNYRTGLIGMPVMTIGGLQLSMLLRPEIRTLGSVIKLNNDDIQYTPDSGAYGDTVNNERKQESWTIDADGLYKVISRTHVGDTRGQVWQTDLICTGINATLQPVSGVVINGVSNQ
jgi:hypothetical protein